MSSETTDLRPALNEVGRLIKRMGREWLATLIASIALSMAVLTHVKSDRTQNTANRADIRAELLQELLSEKADRAHIDAQNDKILLLETKLAKHEKEHD